MEDLEKSGGFHMIQFLKSDREARNYPASLPRKFENHTLHENSVGIKKSILWNTSRFINL